MEVVRHVLSGLSEKESAILKLRFGLYDDEEIDREEYALTEEELEGIKNGISLK